MTSSQVGRLDSDKPAAIRLSGDNILEEHCYFENTDGKVFLHALPDSVTVSLRLLVGLYERHGLIFALFMSVPEWKTSRSRTSQSFFWYLVPVLLI